MNDYVKDIKSVMNDYGDKTLNVLITKSINNLNSLL